MGLYVPSKLTMDKDIELLLQPLNSRQRLFVINLVEGMSQTQAYIKAGYGEDENTAKKCASGLLSSNRNVKAAFDALIARRDQKALALIDDSVASPLEVKQVLSKLLRSNLKNHIDSQGEPELGNDPTAVKEYSHRTHYTKKGEPIVTKELKLESKLEAARELAKIHGMYAPSKHMVAEAIRIEVEHVTKERQTE